MEYYEDFSGDTRSLYGGVLQGLLRGILGAPRASGLGCVCVYVYIYIYISLSLSLSPVGLRVKKLAFCGISSAVERRVSRV